MCVWGGAGSCVLPSCIMALVGGGVLCLAVVYHGFRGGGSCVLPLYIMALGGILGLVVVYHGFRGGGGPRFCRSISWL